MGRQIKGVPNGVAKHSRNNEWTVRCNYLSKHHSVWKANRNNKQRNNAPNELNARKLNSKHNLNAQNVHNRRHHNEAVVVMKVEKVEGEKVVAEVMAVLEGKDKFYG